MHAHREHINVLHINVYGHDDINMATLAMADLGVAAPALSTTEDTPESSISPHPAG